MLIRGEQEDPKAREKRMTFQAVESGQFKQVGVIVMGEALTRCRAFCVRGSHCPSCPWNALCDTPWILPLQTLNSLSILSIAKQVTRDDRAWSALTTLPMILSCARFHACELD